MLGRADALQKLGSKDAAIGLYRTVMQEAPKTKEADDAKVALRELGALHEPPKERPAGGAGARSSGAGAGAGGAAAAARRSEAKESGGGSAAAGGSAVSKAGGGASVGAAPVLRADMTPDEKCLAVIEKHINDPRETIKALTRLGQDEPKSSCVYWHLGNSYAKLHDDRAALAAYRRYLELRPDAQNRSAVETRIKNLAAKVEER
jgi:tetratricopeptide (TPR) repeat protein